jgi:hypothetical protein
MLGHRRQQHTAWSEQAMQRCKRAWNKLQGLCEHNTIEAALGPARPSSSERPRSWRAGCRHEHARRPAEQYYSLQTGANRYRRLPRGHVQRCPRGSLRGRLYVKPVHRRSSPETEIVIGRVRACEIAEVDPTQRRTAVPDTAKLGLDVRRKPAQAPSQGCAYNRPREGHSNGT